MGLQIPHMILHIINSKLAPLQSNYVNTQGAN